MKAFSHSCNRSCINLQLLLFIWMILSSIGLVAQKVIPLYPGIAPGSENWNWEEGETDNTLHKFRVAYNVSKPTLTVFLPDTPNGVSVLLIPGGGSYVVNIINEGEMVARELVKKGITAFVLKYRTGRTTTTDPWNETMSNMRDTALNRRKLEGVRELYRADAFAAIRYLRSHAAEYQLHPSKVGVVGFSAGGGLTLGLCKAEEADARPDFAGLIYTVYRPAEGDTLPTTIPPVFIASATDDVLANSLNSTAIYHAWRKVNRPAELHIYSKGGHGLRGSGASQAWLKRFEEWMVVIGLMK
jgi:dienelactone hydrolase